MEILVILDDWNIDDRYNSGLATSKLSFANYIWCRHIDKCICFSFSEYIQYHSYYTISFNTATQGIIKSIEITFPTGFNIASAKLIEVQGIGAGSVTITGQILKYSVSSPVLVSASKSIKIMISDVTNSASPSNQVSVVTKDNSINSAIIDGPTKSATFTLTQITNPMIGTNAITSTKIAPDSVDTSKIKNGQIMLADMAANSVDSSKIVNNSLVKADISTP